MPRPAVSKLLRHTLSMRVEEIGLPFSSCLPRRIKLLACDVWDHRVLAYHAAVAPERRQAALDAFLAPVSDDANAPALYLVCTDRTSRGARRMTQ